MLRNKILKNVIGAGMFLLLIILPSISFAATINGYVAGIIQFKRSKAMDKEFRGERLKSSGWTRTMTHYQKTIVLSMFSVALDDSKPQKLMEGGVFSLEVQPGEHTIHIFDVEGREVDARKVFVEDDDSVMQVPIIILKDMDNNCCMLPRVSKKTDALPCLDYNGPYGNNKDDQKGVKKYRNFNKSDCDGAMGRGHCWTELMPGRSCNHGGENCSHFIDHPAEFHYHILP